MKLNTVTYIIGEKTEYETTKELYERCDLWKPFVKFIKQFLFDTYSAKTITELVGDINSWDCENILELFNDDFEEMVVFQNFMESQGIHISYYVDEEAMIIVLSAFKINAVLVAKAFSEYCMQHYECVGDRDRAKRWKQATDLVGEEIELIIEHGSEDYLDEQ